MAQAFLNSVKVEEVAPRWQDMVIIDAHATIPQTLKIFVESKIFSAPVFCSDAQEYIGMIDLLDLISFMLDLEKKGSYITHDYMDFIEREELFNTRTSREVLNFAKRYDVVPVPEGTSLLEAMRIMVKHGVPRLPVMFVNQKGDYTGIMSLLTQSAILQFLAKNLGKLSEFSQPLSALGFEQKKLVSIDDHKPAIEAFKLIAENGITGLPVLDSEGKLLANISARDLRLIATDPKMFSYLYLSAGDFVSHIRLSEPTAKTVHPTISCSLEENLLRVIAKMSAAKIHRLYVADSHRYPISVVTVHDIISKIVSGSE